MCLAVPNLQRVTKGQKMKKLLPILLLLTLTLLAKEAILQLDTKGHTALINDIIVTKSGDIISASDDKTIRVWDSTTGEERRKILGQIGVGSGEIFAMALSPDEEFLAVGGYFKSDDIRIYNYKTGKLLKVLKSHTNIVYDLAFSLDGKYLISGSGDRTAKIWRVRDFTLSDTIKFHTKQVYAVKIIKKKGKYFAVTAGDDNQIALYDMQKREIIKSDRKEYKLKYLALSQNHTAVCGFGREIQIYDFHLNHIKTIISETVPGGLAYSPNGEFLMAGTGNHPLNVNIYSVKEHYKKRSSFQKHTNSTIAVSFLNNQTAISGGGNNKEIYIWDRDSAEVKRKIEGVGAVVWSVGVKGESIGWGNEYDCQQKNCSSIQKTLNLKTFKVNSEKRIMKNLKRIVTTKANLSLSHRAGGDYGRSDAILDIKENGKVIESITRDAINGIRHRCYGFYKNFIISGGSNGFLKIYNREGREIANLVGHTGEVWTVALDGDRLVSGSSDQTIRIWDLSKLKMKNEKLKIVEPMLNIFVSKDDEWVVWSKSGYYNASVDGAQYVGYHINQGADKEALFVSSDKYPQLYRPDIIETILKVGSEKRALALVSKKQRVQKLDIASSLPPMLSLLSQSTIITTQSSIKVKFRIESQSKIEKLIVTRNGQHVQRRSIQRAKGQSVTVDLEDGENIISIRAKNSSAMSDAILVRATKTSSSTNIYKPTLYLLTIGVSKYQDSSYNLELADKDANSIADMFQRQEGRIYKEVVTKRLINSGASSDSILDGLDWIEQETTQRDVVVIFMSGHGVNDDKGNYYFLSHNANGDKLRRTAIKWDEIKDTITSLPSKVILLADTCHSGNIMGQGRQRDITGAIKSIIESGTGSIIMTASTGRGYSIEQTSWGHGAFTKALLEGLGEAKADYNSNGEISIKEIDLYVTDRVKELTGGRQKPTTIIPQSVPDFAVGVNTQ